MTLHRHDQSAPVGDHGGSLGRAEAQFPLAPRPWIDLSTGINPHSYPLFDLPASALTRLPEPSRIGALAAMAADVYGAASADHVVAAPGTQVMLPQVMALVAPGRARVLSPTYAEHRRCAALAGHAVEEVGAFDALFEADLAIVVNPNNPDGRVVKRTRLLELANHLAGKGGMLVVDEAFMDVGPARESVAGDATASGLVVLRSFGKFFGLAGVRLGFAIAAPALCARLSSPLGPWAVAGPALEYGLAALADRDWQAAMRGRLTRDAARLDSVLASAGLDVAGGTSLYRFVRTPAAGRIFETLGERGILVRDFAAMPDALRFGLPGDDDAFERLGQALAAHAEKKKTP